MYELTNTVNKIKDLGVTGAQGATGLPGQFAAIGYTAGTDAGNYMVRIKFLKLS